MELGSNLQNTVKKIEIPNSQFQRFNVQTCKRANVPI